MPEEKSLEQAWIANSNAGNTCFEAKEFGTAFQHYHTSFEHAQELLRRREACESCGVPFVQIYLITCFNLGHTHTELGQLADAESWFLKGLHFVTLEVESRTEQDAEAPAPRNDLKIATLNYADFCQRTGRRQIESLVASAIEAAVAAGKSITHRRRRSRPTFQS